MRSCGEPTLQGPARAAAHPQLLHSVFEAAAPRGKQFLLSGSLLTQMGFVCPELVPVVQRSKVAAVRKLQEQVYLGSAFLVHEPGEEQFPGPELPGLLDAHHARGAPHLDGAVVAGCQQQLLLHRAERH